MKKLLYILLISIFGCTSQKYSQSKTLTVMQVKSLGLKKEVFARSGYMVYRAVFQAGQLPDSVKRGTVISAMPAKDTACSCFFKRIK